jgi:hypothetical protein
MLEALARQSKILAKLGVAYELSAQEALDVEIAKHCCDRISGFKLFSSIVYQVHDYIEKYKCYPTMASEDDDAFDILDSLRILYRTKFAAIVNDDWLKKIAGQRVSLCCSQETDFLISCISERKITVTDLQKEGFGSLMLNFHNSQLVEMFCSRRYVEDVNKLKKISRDEAKKFTLQTCSLLRLAKLSVEEICSLSLLQVKMLATYPSLLEQAYKSKKTFADIKAFIHPLITDLINLGLITVQDFEALIDEQQTLFMNADFSEAFRKGKITLADVKTITPQCVGFFNDNVCHALAKRPAFSFDAVMNLGDWLARRVARMPESCYLKKSISCIVGTGFKVGGEAAKMPLFRQPQIQSQKPFSDDDVMAEVFASTAEYNAAIMASSAAIGSAQSTPRPQVDISDKVLNCGVSQLGEIRYQSLEPYKQGPVADAKRQK